jgi:hypothetical protein
MGFEVVFVDEEGGDIEPTVLAVQGGTPKSGIGVAVGVSVGAFGDLVAFGGVSIGRE